MLVLNAKSDDQEMKAQSNWKICGNIVGEARRLELVYVCPHTTLGRASWTLPAAALAFSVAQRLVLLSARLGPPGRSAAGPGPGAQHTNCLPALYLYKALCQIS